MKNVVLDNKNFNDDLELALKKIKRDNCDREDMFCRSSNIYRTTNETISHKSYIDAMRDKKRVIAITGSCDQILNSVLVGGKTIKGVDISVFPKYFAALKLGAMKAFDDKEVFLDYFVGDDQIPPLSSKLHSKVENVLSDEVNTFWNSAFNVRHESDLYRSALFRGFHLSRKRMTYNNPYLQGDNYNITREKLDDALFEFCDMDAFKIDRNSDLGEFDLALLSNMLNYYRLDKPNKDSIEDFKKYVRNLPLAKGGKAVIYNFCFNGSVLHLFYDNDFEVYRVDEHIPAAGIENEIVVYTKQKKKVLDWLLSYGQHKVK